MLVVQLACVAAVERGTYFISNYMQWPVGTVDHNFACIFVRVFKLSI